jgi:NADH:ubiquinone oxidoreductase subunit
MSFGTRLFTMIYGELVGSDEFGNKYYVDKRTKGAKRERRWVIYKGAVEASRVPADWHAWLHRTNGPLPDESRRPTWQQPHQPNLTGTDQAYRQPGHLLAGGHRPAATGDYQAWTPN